MSSYLTPMLLITGISFANKWYSTNQVDLKILVAGGIGTGILAILNNVPGMEPVTTGIAWVAFVALMITPLQAPSPLQNLEKIIGV